MFAYCRQRRKPNVARIFSESERFSFFRPTKIPQPLDQDVLGETLVQFAEFFEIGPNEFSKFLVSQVVPAILPVFAIHGITNSFRCRPALGNPLFGRAGNFAVGKSTERLLKSVVTTGQSDCAKSIRCDPEFRIAVEVSGKQNDPKVRLFVKI